MSDNEFVGRVGPAEPEGPQTAPAPQPPENPARRGRIAAVAASALLALAVVGGVGYTVVTVNGADRDAGAPVWTFPKSEAPDAEGDTEKATAAGLAGMLVPYGTDGWSRGPDLGEYGPDVSLSGAQATALRKEALSDLPRTQRKRLERAIDRQRITGAATRSYLSSNNDSYGYTEDAYTVRIELVQMENKAAVRGIARFQSELLDALDVLRKGPAVEGHKNAHCFLPPKDADEDLDTMFCSAYVGNVLVTATADGAKPLDTKGAAMLLREQLDRIAEPGEAV